MIDTRNEKLPPMPNTDREHWAAVNNRWKRQQKWLEALDIAYRVVRIVACIVVCAATVAGVLIIAVHVR